MDLKTFFFGPQTEDVSTRSLKLKSLRLLLVLAAVGGVSALLLELSVAVFGTNSVTVTSGRTVLESSANGPKTTDPPIVGPLLNFDDNKQPETVVSNDSTTVDSTLFVNANNANTNTNANGIANDSRHEDESIMKVSSFVRRGKAPLLIGIGSVHSASTTTFHALHGLFHMRNSFTEIGVYGKVIIGDYSKAIKLKWVPRVHLDALSSATPYKLKAAKNNDTQQLWKALGTVCPLLDDLYLNGYCFDINALLKDRRSGAGHNRTDLLFCGSESQTRELLDWDRTSHTEAIMQDSRHSLEAYMREWEWMRPRIQDLQITAEDLERVPPVYKAQYDANTQKNTMDEPLSSGPPLAITKTTAYYMKPHTAWIFAREYAHRFDTRFIWNVRDPIKRIWSMGRHWHKYEMSPRTKGKRMPRRRRLNACDLESEALCEDAFRRKQMGEMKSVHLLISALASAKDLGVGGTVTNDDLIALWMQLYYNRPQILTAANGLFSSIYYIPLLFWKRAFEQFGVDFRRTHFRVLQSKWITRYVDFAMNTIRCFAMTGIAFDLSSTEPSEACPFPYRIGMSSLHTVNTHKWDGDPKWSTRRLLMSAYIVPNALMDLQMKNNPSLFLGTWTSWNKAYREQSQALNDTWMEGILKPLFSTGLFD